MKSENGFCVQWDMNPVSYCQFCGNNETRAKDRTCPRCRRVLRGPMKEAYKRWLRMGEENRMCCGRLSADIAFDRTETQPVTLGTNLAFHGKYFEASHLDTSVEYGVSFHPDCASTYYLRDFNHYCDSEDYGELISYEDPDFWAKLERQLDGAAEAAHDAGLSTCEKCGYHYFDDPCCK